MDLAVQADPWVKIKDIEKIYKYLDVTRELKKLVIMKVTVILIEAGLLGTLPKSLKKPEITELKSDRI